MRPWATVSAQRNRRLESFHQVSIQITELQRLETETIQFKICFGSVQCFSVRGNCVPPGDS